MATPPARDAYGRPVAGGTPHFGGERHEPPARRGVDVELNHSRDSAATRPGVSSVVLRSPDPHTPSQPLPPSGRRLGEVWTELTGGLREWTDVDVRNLLPPDCVSSRVVQKRNHAGGTRERVVCLTPYAILLIGLSTGGVHRILPLSCLQGFVVATTGTTRVVRNGKKEPPSTPGVPRVLFRALSPLPDLLLDFDPSTRHHERATAAGFLHAVAAAKVVRGEWPHPNPAGSDDAAPDVTPPQAAPATRQTSGPARGPAGPIGAKPGVLFDDIFCPALHDHVANGTYAQVTAAARLGRPQNMNISPSTPQQVLALEREVLNVHGGRPVYTYSEPPPRPPPPAASDAATGRARDSVKSPTAVGGCDGTPGDVGFSPATVAAVTEHPRRTSQLLQPVGYLTNDSMYRELPRVVPAGGNSSDELGSSDRSCTSTASTPRSARRGEGGKAPPTGVPHTHSLSSAVQFREVVDAIDLDDDTDDDGTARVDGSVRTRGTLSHSGAPPADPTNSSRATQLRGPGSRTDSKRPSLLSGATHAYTESSRPWEPVNVTVQALDDDDSSSSSSRGDRRQNTTAVDDITTGSASGFETPATAQPHRTPSRPQAGEVQTPMMAEGLPPATDGPAAGLLTPSCLQNETRVGVHEPVYVPQMPWLTEDDIADVDDTSLARALEDGEALTFPASRDFWNDFSTRFGLDPSARDPPYYEVTAPYSAARERLPVNQGFTRRFLAAYQQRNSLVVNLVPRESAAAVLQRAAFRARGDFWAFFARHYTLTNRSGLNLQVLCEGKHPVHVAPAEWRRVCNLWEKEHHCSITDKAVLRQQRMTEIKQRYPGLDVDVQRAWIKNLRLETWGCDDLVGKLGAAADVAQRYAVKTMGTQTPTKAGDPASTSRGRTRTLPPAAFQSYEHPRPQRRRSPSPVSARQADRVQHVASSPLRGHDPPNTPPRGLSTAASALLREPVRRRPSLSLLAPAARRGGRSRPPGHTVMATPPPLPLPTGLSWAGTPATATAAAATPQTTPQLTTGKVLPTMTPMLVGDDGSMPPVVPPAWTTATLPPHRLASASAASSVYRSQAAPVAAADLYPVHPRPPPMGMPASVPVPMPSAADNACAHPQPSPHVVPVQELSLPLPSPPRVPESSPHQPYLPPEPQPIPAAAAAAEPPTTNGDNYWTAFMAEWERETHASADPCVAPAPLYRDTHRAPLAAAPAVPMETAGYEGGLSAAQRAYDYKLMEAEL